VTDLTFARLAASRLIGPGLGKAREVVRQLGAVQAQDYPGAKWALGQRTVDATDADVEREFTAGRFLRTHVLRPTWHFVAPEDLRWMLALSAPRVRAAMASYNRQLEITNTVVAASNRALTKALAGGHHLTRAELANHLGTARIGAVSGQRLAHLMMEAELDAVITSGPRRGRQFTYALLEERVPVPRAKQPADRDESLQMLAVRYFRTRGPASLHDFAWWSGLTMGDVRRAVDIAGRALTPLERSGVTYWLGSDQAPPAPRKATAHLLPNYDEYFIGYRDRSAIGERIRSVAHVTGGSALIAHVIAVSGQLVGGWKAVESGGRVVVSLDVVTPLTPTEHRLLKGALQRYGEFLGMPVEVGPGRQAPG
jgi:hypothetical protein